MQTEAATLQACWDHIKSIRAASDANEALVNACQDVPALEVVHDGYAWPS